MIGWRFAAEFIENLYVFEIAEILRAYPPDCRPAAFEPLVESLGNVGGMSGAQFWRLVAPRGTLGLRCWPIEHPTPNTLRFIHAVLRYAAGRGIRYLPVPIAASDGATFFKHAGHLWELAPWLPGAADYEQSPRVEKLRAAMQALAEFHVAVADFPSTHTATKSPGPAPAITHRLQRLLELKIGGFESLSRAITSDIWPEMASCARQFSTELPRVVPLAIARLAPLVDVPLPQQPCIRDIWHDHVLFEGDIVTGLIDFGAMQIDTPATDVARLLGSFVRDDPIGWQAGLAAYTSIRPLSEVELRAAAVLDIAGTILAGCNWLRWIYIDGRQFDQPRQIAERVARISERVNRI